MLSMARACVPSIFAQDDPPLGGSLARPARLLDSFLSFHKAFNEIPQFRGQRIQLCIGEPGRINDLVIGIPDGAIFVKAIVKSSLFEILLSQIGVSDLRQDIPFTLQYRPGY